MFAKKFSLLLIFFISFFANALATTQWSSLQPGLQYAIITNKANPTGQVRAFRIDPHYYTLQLAVAHQMQQTSLFADQMTEEKNVLIAINGGFFSPEMQSLGLRISHSQVLSTVKNISWWGIFLLNNNKPSIIPANAYQFSPQISFAIQAGPRLVVDGHITKVRGGKDARSALGITANGKIIIVVTDNLLLSMQELALLMSQSEKDGGLGCYQALNLDGGSSSQLYAHIKDFSLHVRSLRPVADLVLVVPR